MRFVFRTGHATPARPDRWLRAQVVRRCALQLMAVSVIAFRYGAVHASETVN
jgi:hypothetical protein